MMWPSRILTKWTGDGRAPSRAYPGDAGFDLASTGPAMVPAAGCVDVPLGIAFQWPPGVWGFMVGRSSTFRNLGLMVNPAIIDGGFRGTLFAICRNLTDLDVRIEPGQRIAQIIPLPLLANSMELWQVDALDPTARGQNGFGSSGA